MGTHTKKKVDLYHDKDGNARPIRRPSTKPNKLTPANLDITPLPKPSPPKLKRKPKPVKGLTDKWGNKRSVRVPGIAPLHEAPKTWFNTWLEPIQEGIESRPKKVMVYDSEEGWTGYQYNGYDQVDKNMLLHIWPKWAWRITMGPTSDIPSPPPISIEHTLQSQPIIRHDQRQSMFDDGEETTAQERIARANFREKQRAIERAERQRLEAIARVFKKL